MRLFDSFRGHLTSSRFGILAASLAMVLSVGVAPVHAGHLTITATFDSSITSDPHAASIEATINSAIQVYENDFSNPITVSIYFEKGSGLGSSSKELYLATYSSFLAQLAAQPTDANKTTALAHLPAGPGNPVTGNTNIALS